MRSPQLASLRPCEAGPRHLRHIKPSEHGFGHWAVEPTEGPPAGELIGFVGIAYPGFLPELATRPELGWRLGAAFWGNGYATEAALASRDDAFTRLALTKLISIVHPDNARSRRVTEKVGMSMGRPLSRPPRPSEIGPGRLMAALAGCDRHETPRT